MQQVIIGAGLAGLIAACEFKDASIREAGPVVAQHKALLRFRDESVSKLTGIPFRPVRVDKAVFYGGELHARTNMRMANLYSQKVTGKIAGRSIWNLETATRYIAPPDLHAQLVERHQRRIHEEMPVDHISSWDRDHYQHINTAPLPVILKACGLPVPDVAFEKKAIKVDRYTIPDCDVYQTIYFPENDLRVFRASITGDMLIVESVEDGNPFAYREPNRENELDNIILPQFGLDYWSGALEALESVDQQYGKIIELPREQRYAILHRLTSEFGVYSLGRFATWRNILLDDVVKDIGVVKRLMGASQYTLTHMLASLAPAEADDNMPF